MFFPCHTSEGALKRLKSTFCVAWKSLKTADKHKLPITVQIGDLERQIITPFLAFIIVMYESWKEFFQVAIITKSLLM